MKEIGCVSIQIFGPLLSDSNMRNMIDFLEPITNQVCIFLFPVNVAYINSEVHIAPDHRSFQIPEKGRFLLLSKC